MVPTCGGYMVASISFITGLNIMLQTECIMVNGSCKAAEDLAGMKLLA